MKILLVPRFLAALALKNKDSICKILDDLDQDDLKQITEAVEQLNIIFGIQSKIISSNEDITEYCQLYNLQHNDVLYIWKVFLDIFKKNDISKISNKVIEFYSNYELLVSTLATIGYIALQSVLKPNQNSSASRRPMIYQQNLPNTTYFQIYNVPNRQVVPESLRKLVLQCFINELMQQPTATQTEIRISQQGDKSINLLQQILWDSFGSLLGKGLNKGSIAIRQEYQDWVIELKGDTKFFDSVLNKSQQLSTSNSNQARYAGLRITTDYESINDEDEECELMTRFERMNHNSPHSSV